MSEYIEELTTQISEYADNDKEHGWLTVGKFRFPKRALIWYVFGKMHAMRDLLPEYEAFSFPGIKLQNDNVYHSDVLIGAGFDLDQTYTHDESPENDALRDAEEQIEDEFQKLRRFDFTILAASHPRKRFHCMVYDHEPKEAPDSWSNIHIDDQDPPEGDWDDLRAICIPFASKDYDLVARNADVIITEVGGELAHLAIVSREMGKILIRVTDACTKFPIFTKLRIDLDRMTLEAA